MTRFRNQLGATTFVWPSHSSFVLRLFLLALAAMSLPPAGAGDNRITFKLGADGGVVIRHETTQPRAQFEQQVRMQERMKQVEDGDGDEPDAPAPPTAGKDPKPYPDTELAAKLRALLEEQQDWRFPDGETKIESVEVKSNTIASVTTQSFNSLSAFLRTPHAFWGQSRLVFDSMRFEKDPDGRLRVTLTPYPGSARGMKDAKQSWKGSRISVELRLVLPGKVLSSSLPNTADNATWITVDAKQDESLAAATRLYEAPTVITAELAGLQLDAPLDSKTLSRQPARESGGELEPPITDAGPGFAAEPLSVMVTTLHRFPEGQKFKLEAENVFAGEQAGVTVQANFFAPKGRTLLSASSVRVLKAVDDRGRSLAPDQPADGAPEATAYSSGGGRGSASSTWIQLRLPLPAPDAQSIEQVDAELIAVTAGSWKEMTVTNASTTNAHEIDLADVLPGATLAITKVTSRYGQTTIEARLKGPTAIREIEIRVTAGAVRNVNASLRERSFKQPGPVSTRTIAVQANGNTEDGGQINGPYSFVVRYPVDRKRERVKFSLKGLDLF